MKTTNMYKLFTLLFALIAITSCVEDDEFDTPVVVIEDVNIPTERIIEIDALRTLLEQEQLQNGNDVLTFEADDDTTNDLYTIGYVISNDATGNFFEELIMQNKPSNPTSGVKILVNTSPLFSTYEFGRQVYVKLEGLSVGIDNGVLALGIRDGNQLEQIADAVKQEFLIRNSVVEEIVPLPISFSEFDLESTNIFVRLNNVQFTRSEALGDNRLTFAGEASDEFDGERILESCDSSAATIFSTSTFADFKGILLPQGSGTIDAVLTLNFFGDEFNVVVNDLDGIQLSEGRCDPDFLFCDTASGGGSSFWSENFESFGGFNSEGWTNINLNSGTVDWEEGDFDGNNYAQISGFSSDEDPIEVWLVTPSINLDATSGEEISFDVQTNFNNGNILSAFVSIDFTGDPTTATWIPLDANIPLGDPDGFGDFEPVGPINISCLDGDIHIGFFYQGADPGPTTRYHLDNFNITGN